MCHVKSFLKLVLIYALVLNCRTGKRTHMGLLKDGYNSAIRYYYNNFNDGFRQVCPRCDPKFNSTSPKFVQISLHCLDCFQLWP